jgi:predicted dehydrogenase
LVLDLDAVQYCGSAEDLVVSGFYGEDAAFFDAVQGGWQPAHDFASARQSVEIMECLRERRREYTGA